MLCIGLVGIMLPLFLVAGYNVPSVDDFAFATMAGYYYGDEYGVLEIILMEIRNAYEQWNTWQGLYFSNFVSFIVNAFCMQEYYFVNIVFSLGFLVPAELWAGYIILRYGFGASGGQAIIYTVPCIVLQILLLPSPAEGFYWMCGAIIYTTMLALTLLYIALQAYLLCDLGMGKRKTNIIKGLLLLGTVMVGGSNYICMMLVIGINAGILLYAFYGKHKDKLFYLINYILLIGCVLVCVFSPGSANRQQSAGAHLPAVEAIIRSFVEAFAYIRTWTLLPIGLLMLFMIPVAWKIVDVRKYKYPVPLLFTLGTFCIYAMLFTPNLYALGIIGAYRIQNIYRISLYILLFVNLLYWTGYLHRVMTGRKMSLQVKFSPWLVMGYFVCVSGLIALMILYYGGSTVTSLSAYRSLRNGTAEAYYNMYQQRLEILEDGAVKDAELEPYVDAPYVLFFGDITKDAEAWENVAMAEFYHKNSVFLKQ